MAGIKDKVVTVESLSTVHNYNKNTYMPMVNPTGSGTLSINNIRLGNVLIESTEDAINFTFLDEEVIES